MMGFLVGLPARPDDILSMLGIYDHCCLVSGLASTNQCDSTNFVYFGRPFLFHVSIPRLSERGRTIFTIYDIEGQWTLGPQQCIGQTLWYNRIFVVRTSALIVSEQQVSTIKMSY